jgi:DNA polymerase (family 10)
MDNYAIADNFSMLAKLMDIHGDNSFKAKSYSSTAFAIEKLPIQLIDLPKEKIFTLKGIGDSIGKKIVAQIETGRLTELDEYVVKTPLGILEMMKIKGLGPKKIQTIWKELELESIGELLYACNENRLCLFKGFGQKTQQNIKDSIEFYLGNQGSYLYSQIEEYAETLTKRLQKDFRNNKFLLTGDFRRQAEVIHKLEWVSDATAGEIESYFKKSDYKTEITDNFVTAKGPENVALHFYPVATEQLYSKLFSTSACPEFVEEWTTRFGETDNKAYASEEEIFEANRLEFIPAYLRETRQIIDKSLSKLLPNVLQKEDIKGIIHSHSNWSDGSHTIEEMAKGAIATGLEYLVISDHSKSAFYAQGLFPDRIKAQHELIDELNEKFKPFRIFKSIESDILNDGNLDYDDDVLASFDLVITSVHSNLKMTEAKAMARLLKAISNPYTTILGHMTGRLLLSRNGYPVDYEAIIEACATHNVVIELNAHPRRLDMDWRWISAAVDKGVLISIDPDAHAVEAFDHTRFGVLAAQKGGLTKEQNLSSFNLQQFENFLAKQQLKRS